MVEIKVGCDKRQANGYVYGLLLLLLLASRVCRLAVARCAVSVVSSVVGDAMMAAARRLSD